MEKLQSKSGQYPHSASLTIIEGDLSRLAPGPGGPPPFVPAELPVRYGMPLFELLVVDPDFVFISWELCAQQLERAERELGTACWQQRVLTLRLTHADAPDTELARRELYGELGRWFIELRRPDTWLRAELGFQAGNAWHLLASAGPLLMPRTEPVDGDFTELFVNYGAAPDGQLTMLSSTGGGQLSAASIAALAQNMDPAGWPGDRPGRTEGSSAGSLWSRRG